MSVLPAFFASRRFVRWRAGLASSRGRVLGAALLLFMLLAVIVELSLRLEYRAEADEILNEAGRSAQKQAARTTEVLDRVSQTTLLVKHLRETGNPLTLRSLSGGGVLAQEVTQALLVSDVRGFVIEATTDQLPLNIADEAHFKRLRQLAVGAVDLGQVEQQPALNSLSMPLSRRISGPQGEFAGVVTALVPPVALLFEQAGSEMAGTAISVVGREDGIVRARLLDGKLSSGARIDIAILRERVQSSRRTGLPTKSNIDGVYRFIATVEVERYPLLSLVAVDAEAALASYRRSRQRILLWAGAVGLLLLAGTVLLLSQARRIDLSRRRQLEAEARLRATLEGSLDSVAIMRAVRGADGELLDLEIIDANARAAEFIGPGTADIIGRHICELAPSLREEGFLKQFGQVIATRRPRSSEVLATDPHLAGRWLHHQVVAVGDGIALISRDVSERRLAAQALAENRNFLQQLLDYLPMPVYAKSMRPENFGRFLFWNRAAERTFHRPAESVVGQTVREVYPAERAAILEAQDAQVLANAEPQRFTDQVFDGPAGRRYIDSIKAAVRGADGQLGHLLVIAEDITERRSAAERLRLSARVLAETADAVVLSDAEDRILDVNPAFLTMSGHAGASLLLQQPAAVAGLPVIALSGSAPGQRWVGEAELRCADGRRLDIWLSASRIYDDTGQLTHHARVFSDISRLKAQAQELAEMARRDSLTGLPNRRHFDERLAEALLRAARSGQLLALVFIDLDGFKTVNDQLGHEAGDHLLIEVAQRLRACVRATDLVCRLGGDEFTIVLEDAGSEASVRSLCERIVESLSLPHRLAGREVWATPSIGLALALPGEAADSLVRRADDAMYGAKRAGKARYALAE